MTRLQPTYILEDPRTEVYVGDCRAVLPDLPRQSVDLIFADPPFNWNVSYDTWDDRMPADEYLAFTRGWLDECLRALAPHGSLWINIPDDWAAEIVLHLKGRGLEMVNWCIWHFRFGQCRDTNFIVSKTHVLYFARDRRNRRWNPDAVLVPSDRASVYADPRTEQTRTPGQRVPLDVWYGKNWGRVQGNNGERQPGHKNQLPEVYLQRVVAACSDEGDLVLDPFLGSGTTCTVARAMGRRSIGIECDPVIARSAVARIKEGPVREVGTAATISVGRPKSIDEL